MRGQPSPQSAVQSRAEVQAVSKGTGTVFLLLPPPESCKRISHITGKHARGELCLLMRRNHSAWRVCGWGLPIGLPPPPLLWASGARGARSPPDSRFTGPAAGSDRMLQTWRWWEQVAMTTQVKAQSAQGQPGFCLLVGRTSSSGWRVVGASPNLPASL